MVTLLCLFITKMMDEKVDWWFIGMLVIVETIAYSLAFVI